MSDGHDHDSDWRPVPDPTLLTMKALEREIGALRDLLTASFEGHWNLDDERFREIAERFRLLEERRSELKGDTTKAIEAALAAQKDDANKLAQQIKTTTDSLSDKIDDVKERVQRVENLKQGAWESRTETRANIGAAQAAVALLIAALGALAFYFGIHNKAPAVMVTPTVTAPAK